MNLNLKFNKDSLKKIPRLIGDFWMSHFKLIASLFFALVLLVSGYVWYSSLNEFSWSAEEKNQFIGSQIEQKDLKRESLENIIKETKNKKEKYETNFNITNSIFGQL